MRPALLAKVRRLGAGTPEPAFTAIVVHLKAGTSEADVTLRKNAVLKLESYVRGLVAAGTSPSVVVLGDFSTAPTEATGPEIMAPFVGNPSAYDLPTWSAVEPFTFIPDKLAQDQIINTSALREERGGEEPVVERLDQKVSGYEMRVSDHLPVVLKFPFKKR